MKEKSFVIFTICHHLSSMYFLTIGIYYSSLTWLRYFDKCIFLQGA